MGRYEKIMESVHELFEPYYLKMLKRHGLKCEEAVALSNWSLEQTKALRDEFCQAHPNSENETTLALLRDVQKEIMKISVKKELSV